MLIPKAIANIREHLAHLDTLSGPDAIATYLEWLRITGLQHSAHRCPLAVYLSRQTGQWTVTVGPGAVCISDGHGPMINLSDKVSRFIDQFDTGRYPRLMRKFPTH